MEPLGGAKVADDPRKIDLCRACVSALFLSTVRRGQGTVYLGETRRLGVVEVVHAVPD